MTRLQQNCWFWFWGFVKDTLDTVELLWHQYKQEVEESQTGSNVFTGVFSEFSLPIPYMVNQKHNIQFMCKSNVK